MINCMIRSSPQLILAAEPRLLTPRGGDMGGRGGALQSETHTIKCDSHKVQLSQLKYDSHKVRLAQLKCDSHQVRLSE